MSMDMYLHVHGHVLALPLCVVPMVGRACACVWPGLDTYFSPCNVLFLEIVSRKEMANFWKYFWKFPSTQALSTDYAIYGLHCTDCLCVFKLWFKRLLGQLSNPSFVICKHECSLKLSSHSEFEHPRAQHAPGGTLEVPF